jgi:serine/threonine protein kinase/Tol biopolymer transport system component
VTLAPGVRFGVYEVSAPIGEGGMGQVYGATDTRLKRQVAIKIIAPSLVPDGDRRARFQREAEVLAALNHPSIAAIYGVEEADGVEGLVMEFVPGDDLAQRIARGPVPLDEALPLARQIAEALEAAHEHGVVHRDLKPANIKVRDDGTVKVLDFGLAKMLEPATVAPSSVSLPPTITTPGVTQRGVVLGTAAYMSPEQARGKPADRRSDVWAFGCVLYEMLTGTRAFEGTEIADVLAAVVRDEPDWTRLPADTPPGVRRLLRRALRKDRRQRLADMADVRIELDDSAGDGPVRDLVPAPPGGRGRERWWALLAIASLLALAAVGVRTMGSPQPDPRVVRFEVQPPPGGRLESSQPISPDGRLLALVATTDGKSQLWIRALDDGTARPLPGTEGATRSFWSPDSRRLGFFVDGDLKEVGVDGSGLRLMVRGPLRDGVWNRDGVILAGGQRGRPLVRVSERGGVAIDETTLATEPAEISHDYPEFLPDGRHYIYLARSGVGLGDFNSFVGTLGSTARQPLPGIRTAAKYSPTGHLLFMRGLTLMAQAFDADRLQLSGDPFPVSDPAAGGRTASFSVSENGTLAFLAGGGISTQLSWFDPTGKLLGPVAPTGVYENPSLSPDGRVVAFDRGQPSDVWLLDLARGGATRITTGSADDRQAVWSPDGQMLAFSSNRGGLEGLYERTVGAADDRLVWRSETPAALSDWSRDGRYLAFASGGDIWALPRFGDRQPIRVTASPVFQEAVPTFSQDGRWIAYQSEESTGITRAGEGDVFVQSFPEKGFVRQVSTGGGFGPRWSADGKSLFYVARDGMLTAVAVTARGDTLEFGPPTPLFRPPFNQTPLGVRARYSLAKDGRVLVRVAPEGSTITVIVNWFEELKRGLARD